MSNDDKCQLKLLGITYNQIESGVYALILQEIGGEQRHIPIVIGFAEAQSIECKLQDVVTPRPLTHDLMINILNAFSITLKEINIYYTEEGVFTAELTLNNSQGTYIIDSRSSDAIALAIRADAPIYTSRSVLEEVGYIPGNKPRRTSLQRLSHSPQNSSRRESSNSENDLSSLTDQQLQTKMQQAADEENYELAAKYKEEIDRRNNIPLNL